MEVLEENPRVPDRFRPINLLLTNVRKDGPDLVIFLQFREKVGVSYPGKIT